MVVFCFVMRDTDKLAASFSLLDLGPRAKLNAH